MKDRDIKADRRRVQEMQNSRFEQSEKVRLERDKNIEFIQGIGQRKDACSGYGFINVVVKIVVVDAG